MIKRPIKKELDEKTSNNMKTRTITGIVLAVLAIPALFLGGWFFIVLVALTLGLATHEFINAPQKTKISIPMQIFIYVMIYSFVFWIFIKNNIMNNDANEFAAFDITEWKFNVGFNDVLISTMGVVVLLFVLFFTAIITPKMKMADVYYLFTMTLFVGIGFQSFLFLRYFPFSNFLSFKEVFGVASLHENGNYIHSSLLILYIVIGTFATDIGAYFIGVFFGKNKMNERISPNKTWEGFGGGIGVSILFSFTFAISLAATGYPILPWLTVKNWYWILFLSALMPLMANLGDFTFSTIKRELELKDYGTILKGMGGVLDRVDSLITVAFGISIIIILISNTMLTGNPFLNHTPSDTLLLIGLLV